MPLHCSHVPRFMLAIFLAGQVSLASPAEAQPNYDFDLVANTPLAHVIQAGLVADAASPGFAKYLRDNLAEWGLSAVDQGRRVALPPGRQVRLWLPVGPELADKALVLQTLLRPLGKGRVAILVQGRQVADLEVDARWQTLEAALPRGIVREGLVEVRLLFRRSYSLGRAKTPAVLRYMRLAEAGAARLPEDEAALVKTLATRSGEALRLPRDGGLDYYVTPVAGLALKGRVSGGTLEIHTQQDGQKPVLLTSSQGTLDQPLTPLAGKAVRLMLRARGGEVLVQGGTLGGAKAQPVRAPTPPRRVVFWLIDALRSDKLDFYDRRGKTRPQVKTPNLSQIARAGAVFEPFWVNSNESKAGHASYFTGTYPQVHRVIDHAAKLDERFLTLAEVFKEAGFRTAAFISNGYISTRWNFLQGFDFNINFIREELPNDASQAVKSALPWVDKQKEHPFYLYLGTADPHVTYNAHPGLIEQYDTTPYDGPYRRYLAGKTLEKIKTTKRTLSKRDRDRIEALYENEIAWNDRYFGRLMAELKKRGLDKDTLVIIAADHGEEFWEHGSCGHGHNLHQEMVSVPMVLYWPGVIPAAKVITGHDGTDLFPTILDIMGRPLPPEVQGESLLPYLKSSAVYPRAMVATKELTMHTLRVNNAKVILRGPESLRVFDLSTDPAEHKDLDGKRPILTLCALDPLSLFVPKATRWNKTRWGVPNNLKPAFTTDNP